MQILKGGGPKKPWRPFPGSSFRDRKIARRNARLRKLMQAGTIRPLSKDEARALTANLAKP